EQRPTAGRVQPIDVALDARAACRGHAVDRECIRRRDSALFSEADALRATTASARVPGDVQAHARVLVGGSVARIDPDAWPDTPQWRRNSVVLDFELHQPGVGRVLCKDPVALGVLDVVVRDRGGKGCDLRRVAVPVAANGDAWLTIDV